VYFLDRFLRVATLIIEQIPTHHPGNLTPGPHIPPDGVESASKNCALSNGNIGHRRTRASPASSSSNLLRCVRALRTPIGNKMIIDRLSLKLCKPSCQMRNQVSRPTGSPPAPTVPNNQFFSLYIWMRVFRPASLGSITRYASHIVAKTIVKYCCRLHIREDNLFRSATTSIGRTASCYIRWLERVQSNGMVPARPQRRFGKPGAAIR